MAEDANSATCNLGFTIGIAWDLMTEAQQNCAQESLILLAGMADVDWSVIGMALARPGETINDAVSRIRRISYKEEPT